MMGRNNTTGQTARRAGASLAGSLGALGKTAASARPPEPPADESDDVPPGCMAATMALLAAPFVLPLAGLAARGATELFMLGWRVFGLI